MVASGRFLATYSESGSFVLRMTLKMLSLTTRRFERGEKRSRASNKSTRTFEKGILEITSLGFDKKFGQPVGAEDEKSRHFWKKTLL